MEGDNRKERENIHFPRKMKKKQNSPEKGILIHSPGDSAQNIELSTSGNKSKAKFVANDMKSEVEKEEPKQRESDSNIIKGNTVATNYSKNSTKNFTDVKNLPVVKKPHQKKMNFKNSFKKKFENQAILQTEGNIILNELSEDTFEYEDIINNSRVLELIQDLVNCFIINSKLPENKLQTLKVSLTEKTCLVLLNILNSCVKKIFNKMINSDFFQEFKKKHVSKKDACCQTSFSDISEVEESEVQQNISPQLEIIF